LQSSQNILTAVFSGHRKQENECIQLEADSTIGAGGYLGRRERVAVTSQAPVVVQIASQFALDLRGNQGTDTQLSNLSPARRRHVPQALSIVTATLPHFQMGRGFPTLQRQRDWCRRRSSGERGVNQVENFAKEGWEVVMMVPIRSSSIRGLVIWMQAAQNRCRLMVRPERKS
jgi:hypothetical protein